ncbi:unnamed protein product [Owenia fusiformis]|uniref:Uncharacterized protein n=1 Tax=Owenia fusiformis TaxID=6347 RepID=A0A8J1TWM6_OWEFU|nr:unnamed protein product [Owenia fusiformis]
MSVSYQDIVKKGYVRLKGKNLGAWQRRWVMLRKASSKGPRRLEKYPDESASRNVSAIHKAIELSEIKSISRLPNDIKKHAVSIVFQDLTSRCFAVESEAEADEWVEALCKECGIATIHVSPPDVTQTHSTQDKFNVYLLPTPALDISGECLLQITSSNVNLWDILHPGKLLVSWPVGAIRRYGRDDSQFTFEAGRFCDTGEGMFMFSTAESDLIHRKLHTASLALAATKVNTQNTQNSQNARPRRPVRSRTLPETPLPPLPHGSPPKRPENLPPSDLKDDYDGTWGVIADDEAGLAIPLIPPPPPPLTQRSRSQSIPNTTVGASPSIPPLPASARRPLPELPSPTADEGVTVPIYEEKYLTPDFRNFLQKRKDDDDTPA